MEIVKSITANHTFTRETTGSRGQTAGRRIHCLPPQKNGFTLIEVLIVMVIISIVAGVAVLSINRNPNTQYETIAKQIINDLHLAEEQAILLPASLRLRFHETDFQFFQITSTKELPLAKHAIPQGIQITSNAPILVATTGDISPFIIYIGKVGDNPRYKIINDEHGIKHEAMS